MDLRLATSIDLANPVVGDLCLTNGQFTFVGTDPTDETQHAEAVAQSARIRLLFFLGDWYLDQRLGVPYWTEILVKNPDLERIKTLFKKTIAGTPGISYVSKIELEFDRSLRTLTLTWDAVLDDGQTISGEALDVPFVVA